MEPHFAPSTDGYAGAHGGAVPAFSEGGYDLDGSLAPAPQRVSEPASRKKSVGWLAPLVLLFGFFLVGIGAFMALLAAAVFGVVAALWLFIPGGFDGSEAEFILVPDTLPVQEEADAEFILVPDTLPVHDEAPKKAPAGKARPTPRRPAPAVKQVPGPAAPPAEEAKGEADKASLEAVPVDEAVRRVKGKAGRGEARSTHGH